MLSRATLVTQEGNLIAAMEEIDLLSRALTVRSKDVAQWLVQSAEKVSQNLESKGEEQPPATDNVSVFAMRHKLTSCVIWFNAL